MAFNPGDRVKWKWNEPGADPKELVGKVVEVVYTYVVRWDDGSRDEGVEEDDLKYESH